MLNWIDRVIKVTFGIGGLALTGMLADTTDGMPFWLVLIVAMLPVAIFVFIKPEELASTIVKYSHLFGALWYLVAAATVSTLFMQSGLPEGWAIYGVLILAGIIPSVYVLYKILTGAYIRS